MKKFLSTILAVVMVLSSMAMVVSAEETAYITAVNAEGVTVGTYSTVDAAANAVGAGGTLTVTGDLYVDTVQTIAYDGITLEGAATGGAIIASDNFKNSSVKNRKALLTITVANAVDGVDVKNISFDGSAYGDTLTTLDNTDETRFSVVRVNQGIADFNNVYITGSPRTLLTIGTSDYEATVTSTALRCDGETNKSFTDATLLKTIYPDIDVTKGDFTLGSNSEVNGFICEDVLGGGTFTNSCTTNHFTLRYNVGTLFTIYRYVTATAKHYVDVYNDSSYTESDKAKYASSLSYNTDEINRMATYVAGNVNADSTTAEGLYDMLVEAAETYNVSGLDDEISMLATALGK